MNELSIIPQNNGFLASSEEKSIFFPNAELWNVGCKNCIWKLHNQCPYGFVDEQAKEEGICNEMILFLSSLAKKNSTLTEVWEKFYVYKARLQESVDYADFVNLNKKVREREQELEKRKYSEFDYELLDRLKMDRNAAKLWWARLHQHVTSSMQKINDREAKQSDTPRLAGIHSSGTINFNITKEIKQIEEN